MMRRQGAELSVLMFHGLRRSVPEHSGFTGTSSYLMLQEDFEACVSWCLNAGRIVTLADLPRYVAGEATEPGFLLTFDDGLRSVAELACPILSRHAATAVVFITTGWVDSGVEPAIFRVEQDLWERIPEVLSFHRGSVVFQTDVGSREQIPRALEALWKFCFRHRIGPLSMQCQEFGFDGEPWNPDRQLDDPEGWMPASWDALRTATEMGLLEVGAHGVTHVPWTWLTVAQLRAEAELSVERIRQELGRAPTCFSYPHGLNSPDARLVAQSAFQWSFTSQARSVQPGRDVAGALPRFHIPSERPVQVASELRFPLVQRMRRKLRMIVGNRAISRRESRD